MQILYVMQGVPGSGKSFMARAIQALYYVPEDDRDDAMICSTDDFFYVDGEYKFDPSKLPEYHGRNLERAKKALSEGFTVIVDNTNIQRWACREYVRFAVMANIPVVFVRVDGRFKNAHGVPDEVVEKMRANMETLDIEGVLASIAPWEKV